MNVEPITINLNVPYVARLEQWFECNDSITIQDAWKELRIPDNSLPAQMTKLRAKGYVIRSVSGKSKTFHHQTINKKDRVYVVEERP